MNDINLPAIISNTTPVLQALTDALGVTRDVVASDDEIHAAWGNLPRAMQKIPPALRDKGMARMCIAVASGLFDSNKWGQSNINSVTHRQKRGEAD